jgi:GNAT superfamily N-acetyltransferase
VRQSRESGAPPGASQGALALRRVEVVRTYLTLDDPAQLRAARAADASARIERRSPCPVSTYRRLYREVGEPWFWHDRLEWSDEQLEEYLAAPSVGIWELEVDGASAGYFELQRHGDGSVEIVYFGLLQRFIGRGLGGFMLTRAVTEAWAMGANRVWLHTCTLDSDRALPGYKARGFREFKTERLEVDIEGTQVVGERLLRGD